MLMDGGWMGRSKKLSLLNVILLLALSIQSVWRITAHGWWEREQIILVGTITLAALFFASFALHRRFPRLAHALCVAVAILGVLLIATAQLPQYICVL